MQTFKKLPIIKPNTQTKTSIQTHFQFVFIYYTTFIGPCNDLQPVAYFPPHEGFLHEYIERKPAQQDDVTADGLFLGWKNILTAFFIACLIAGVLGSILILLKKRERKDKIPFGPFLAIGILFSMFYGKEIIHRYLQFAGIL
jgi:hypothetical protein